jgi:hypothetical protein
MGFSFSWLMLVSLPAAPPSVKTPGCLAHRLPCPVGKLWQLRAQWVDNQLQHGTASIPCAALEPISRLANQLLLSCVGFALLIGDTITTIA